MRVLVNVLIILVLWASYSCRKSPKCWGKDQQYGLITSVVEVSCTPINNQEEFILNNEKAFQRAFTDPQSGEMLCDLPWVDFKEHTLLGLYATGACNVKYIREVIRDKGAKECRYHITVKECGQCKSQQASYNWVTIPKLPAGWTVDFEVENK